MSLILTKPQAEAVYSAMCALNNAGGKVDVTFGTPDDGINVYQYKWRASGKVYVYRMSRGAVMGDECYADQSAFAAAYGLQADGQKRRAERRERDEKYLMYSVEETRTGNRA